MLCYDSSVAKSCAPARNSEELGLQARHLIKMIGVEECGQSGQSKDKRKIKMAEDLFYTMNKSKLGKAVIINNLDQEQTPTRRDVEVMKKVLKEIGGRHDFVIFTYAG